MARAHVKRDDLVVVISGDHKGKQGKVLAVDRDKDRVVIEGVNLRRHAVRRTADNPQGGLEEKEQSLHMSNVMRQDVYEARQAARKAAASNK
jgi:large subunit ribosomal protein L24